MPNIKYKEFLTKVTTEDIVNKMSEAKHACTKSVGDVDLNTKNRGNGRLEVILMI